MSVRPLGRVMIESRLSQKLLDSRLEQGARERYIPGEQWFRKGENWFSITAFSNPFKTVYTELAVLTENRGRLMELVGNMPLVFYGVGTGDTEAAIVQWALEAGLSPAVHGIDVNWEFLEVFLQTLKNLSVEYGRDIFYRGHHTLFQMTDGRQFGSGKKAHICLGNTVGNFPQEEIFGVFKSNARKGDLLVLGVQLGKSPKKLLEQYRDNAQMKRLIMAAIESRKDLPLRSELAWDYNKKTGAIEAWLGGVQVFRSKKYDVGGLVGYAKQFGFEKVDVFERGDCAVAVFKKA